MALSKMTKDYVTLWDISAASIYTWYGALVVIEVISAMQVCSKYKSSSCSVTFGEAFAIAIGVLAFITGIAHIFHTRRYFRGWNPRCLSGFVATFSLAIVNTYALYQIFKQVSHVSIPTLEELFNSSMYSWIVWVIIALMIITEITAIIALVMLFVWSQAEVEEEWGNKKPEIAAYASSHAMGYPESSTPTAVSSDAVVAQQNAVTNSAIPQETHAEISTNHNNTSSATVASVAPAPASAATPASAPAPVAPAAASAPVSNDASVNPAA